MSLDDSARYTKVGATFASAAEAYANKNSLYGAELTAAVDACYAKMLADGVLLEPVTYNWDQSTSTLTVRKIVASKAEYNAAITFDGGLCVTRSTEAGWTLIPNS
jgi:hypothetical protein